MSEHCYIAADIFLSENYLFRTLEEINRLVRTDSKLERACFFIYDVPIGVHCYEMYGQRIRSYSGQGHFVAESKSSNIEDSQGYLEPFLGRIDDECLFAPGDIVAVFRSDKMRLEIVGSRPVNIEYVDKNYPILLPKGNKYPDYTDDSYMTLVCTDDLTYIHDHASIVHCFPTTNPDTIPEHIRHTLVEAFNHFMQHQK